MESYVDSLATRTFLDATTANDASLEMGCQPYGFTPETGFTTSDVRSSAPEHVSDPIDKNCMWILIELLSAAVGVKGLSINNNAVS